MTAFLAKYYTNLAETRCLSTSASVHSVDTRVLFVIVCVWLLFEPLRLCLVFIASLKPAIISVMMFEPVAVSNGAKTWLSVASYRATV